MTRLPGKFTWYEHLSSDVERARSFYGSLFGWNSDAVPVGETTYHLIVNGADGIGGFRQSMPGLSNCWMSYLSAEDVDVSSAAAAAAGATVLMPPTDFPPIGRGAGIADPQGAVLQIWTGAQDDRPDRDPVPPGDWTWNECMTPDPARAVAFYESVFGYAHDEMDMGEMGTYYVLTKDGVPRGGIMALPDPGIPVGWVPYVSVVDCDAAAAKAQSLGATVTAAPKDIPEVGRIAVLIDPLGAWFAIMRGARAELSTGV